jgi:hypothetical protein
MLGLAIHVQTRGAVVMEGTAHLAMARNGNASERFDILRRLDSEQGVSARRSRTGVTTGTHGHHVVADVANDFVEAMTTRRIAMHEFNTSWGIVLVVE